MCERLLAISVFSHAHGHGRSWSMCVIGRSYDDGIYLVAFGFQHDSEICVRACPFVFRGRCPKEIRIDISKSDNVLTGTTCNIRSCSVSGPNGGNIEFFQ